MKRKKTVWLTAIIVVMLSVGGLLAVDYINNAPLSDFSTENKTTASRHYSKVEGISDAIIRDGNKVIVDFGTCSRGRASLSFGLGSTQFAFEGIKIRSCVFHFGTEIENPGWDGDLDVTCKVPSNLGQRTYPVGLKGAVWDDEFKSYCKQDGADFVQNPLRFGP